MRMICLDFAKNMHMLHKNSEWLRKSNHFPARIGKGKKSIKPRLLWMGGFPLHSTFRRVVVVGSIVITPHDGRFIVPRRKGTHNE